MSRKVFISINSLTPEQEHDVYRRLKYYGLSPVEATNLFTDAQSKSLSLDGLFIRAGASQRSARIAAGKVMKLAPVPGKATEAPDAPEMPVFDSPFITRLIECRMKEHVLLQKIDEKSEELKSFGAYKMGTKVYEYTISPKEAIRFVSVANAHIQAATELGYTTEVEDLTTTKARFMEARGVWLERCKLYADLGQVRIEIHDIEGLLNEDEIREMWLYANAK